MKKLIVRMYSVAGVLFFFLFLYGLLNLRLIVDRTDVLNSYSTLVNYAVSTTEDSTAYLGEKKIIRFTTKEIDADFNTLCFFTKYQGVRVWVSGECIYELKTKKGALIPQDPGFVFNCVVLKEGYNNKEITIELIPYFVGMNYIPSIRIGARSEIISDVVVSNLPVIFLSAAVITIGIIQFIIAFINRKRTDFGVQPAVCHAVSIILIGLWKILDCEVVALFGSEIPLADQLSFFIFMLLPIMFSKMLRDQLEEGAGKFTRIADGCTIFGILIMIILQLTGISRLRDGLWMIQGCLIIAFVCAGVSLVRSIQKNGLSKENKTAVIFTGFAFVWMFADMISNYVTGGVTAMPFSILLFLIFLVILVFNRIQISRKGMEEGMQAMQYKKLAFHDALTGFYNRAAYMEYLSNSGFSPDRSIIIAFDLNNLKKCNDELGHEKGDIYIKESAKIIMDCFGEKGRCYRLGGDEFSVILEGTREEECEGCIRRMKDRVERFNRASKDIHMGIACGWAKYDPIEDEDIHATLRRADKMMYEMKFEMKRQSKA